jgi:hypothetical protein
MKRQSLGSQSILRRVTYPLYLRTRYGCCLRIRRQATSRTVIDQYATPTLACLSYRNQADGLLNRIVGQRRRRRDFLNGKDQPVAPNFQSSQVVHELSRNGISLINRNQSKGTILSFPKMKRPRSCRTWCKIQPDSNGPWEAENRLTIKIQSHRLRAALCFRHRLFDSGLDTHVLARSPSVASSCPDGMRAGRQPARLPRGNQPTLCNGGSLQP